MSIRRVLFVCVLWVFTSLVLLQSNSSWAQTPQLRIASALDNISQLIRPNKIGYATFWDGNKYIQCKRIATKELSCEAAGTMMQPSLRHSLTPEKIEKLTNLGWFLDNKFGNYIRIFPAELKTIDIADKLFETFNQVYNLNYTSFELKTTWVNDRPCPPRNGLGQNLAGSITDAQQMMATAVLAAHLRKKRLLNSKLPNQLMNYLLYTDNVLLEKFRG